MVGLPVYPSSRLPVSSFASPAVALFVERARAVLPGFELDEENAEAVIEICRRLEGLPLAIELAAARVGHLPPPALLERLERRLPLLTGGPRDAPARHRTMRDAIGWSVGLLDPEDRALFARLGVFSGGFTLDAAGALESEGRRVGESEGKSSFVPSDPPTFRPSDLDSIAALVDSSLVQTAASPSGEARFTMLETIREYAWDLLRGSGELDRAAAGLADWLVALNERATEELRGPDRAIWMARLDAERANFRAMTTWALGREDAETALRLTTKATWMRWEPRGFLYDESHLMERALEIAERKPEGIDPQLLGRGLVIQGKRLATTGDFPGAYRVFETAIRLMEQAEDDAGLASAQGQFAIVLSEGGECGRSREMYERAFAYLNSFGEPRRLMSPRFNGARMMIVEGDLVEARARLHLIAPMVEATSDERDMALVAYFQGLVELYAGRLDEARAALAELPGRLAAVTDRYTATSATMHLALVHSLSGETVLAAELVGEALAGAREIAARPIMPSALEVLAGVLLDAGRVDEAARMLGAASGVRTGMGARILPVERPRRVELERRASTQLGAEAYATAEAAARAMPLGQMLTVAIGLAAEIAAASKAVSQIVEVVSGSHATFGAAALTSRERTVLSQLVEGLSDREIADRLCISTRTASSHVGRILAKLDVSTRTAATALAIREGLA